MNSSNGFFATVTNLRMIPVLSGVTASTLGIFFNVIIIHGIHRKKLFNKPTFFFIANLSVCDILLSLSIQINITILILTMTEKLPSIIHIMLCKIATCFVYWSYAASMQTLLIISSESYRAIFHPSRALNANKAKLLCLLAWIITFTISLPFLITATTDDSKPKLCIPYVSHTVWTTIINTLLFIFLYAIPASAMIVLYTLILHQLGKRHYGLRIESRISKYFKRKTIYMLLTTTIMFLIFTAP
ncbi:Mu-type opioid receptor [Trichoplax sp. H2]|nr:Mu-type opioid receptor [Trichoplax sp. H2]|eukprot:RDD36326.1 Mu-type opioid receptor [Trichoplax sp. H2]